MIAKKRKSRSRGSTAGSTPVIIRYEGKGPRSEWHRQDLVAIFPAQAGTNDPNMMACYKPGEGHASCSSNYAGTKTEPATAQQIKTMLAQLRALGYKKLRVVRRPSSHHRAERVRQIRR